MLIADDKRRQAPLGPVIGRTALGVHRRLPVATRAAERPTPTPNR